MTIKIKKEKVFDDGCISVGNFMHYNPNDKVFAGEASDLGLRGSFRNVTILNTDTKVSKVFRLYKTHVCGTEDNEVTHWELRSGELKLLIFND